MKEAREGHRGQHALALGEGLVQSAVQPSGKGGGLGWAPWSFGSLPFRESFLGQQPKSRPLQAGMLGNTGEQRALRSVSLRGLWGRSRDQRSGFQECSWMDCFLVGRENAEDCLLLQENSAVGLFPVSLEPAWGGGGEGGGCQAHVCTGQATGKQSQGGGQGGLVPSPMAAFSRGTGIHPPATVHTPQGGTEMDVRAMVHIRPSPATDQVCVCGGGGRGTVLLRPQAF